ncbi:MAG: CPBP family intramembrane glutamic endopeptidase [Pirellulaceae bacterium]
MVFELLFLIVMLLLSAVTAVVVRRRRKPGQPWLQVEPRPPATWGLLDVTRTLLLFVLFQIVALQVLQSATSINPAAGFENMSSFQGGLVMGSDAIVKLTVVVVSLGIIALRDRQLYRRLGLAGDTFVRDLKIGGVAFLILAGPVYTIQGLLTQMFPSEHPLMTVFEREPSWWLFGVLSFVAVIAAPIAEEFMFRMLIQGWLEDLTRRLHGFQSLSPEPIESEPVESQPVAAEQTASMPRGEQVFADDIPPVQADADEPNAEDGSNPYVAPQATEQDAEIVQAVEVAHTNVPRWPLFLSAALFAILHASHGPDPIPLFILAVGLGYVYRATHRLLPCVILHLLLNASSMAMLWLSVGVN